MRHNPNITKAQLVAILGISDTAVDNAIRFLRENGFIKRIGENKNGYWEVLAQVVDPVTDPVNDPIYDELNDLELAIMRIIKNNPGLNAPKILEILMQDYPNATIDMVKNSLKRKLAKYCRFDGSFKNGGYIIIK